MLLPISVSLCCLGFNHEMSQNYALLPVFQNYSAVLYSSRRNILLLISENLCCLNLNHEVSIWICCPIQMLKELLNEAQLFAVFLTEKGTGFPKRYFPPRWPLPNLFLFIQHPFLSWWVLAALFVENISGPCNSWVT